MFIKTVGTYVGNKIVFGVMFFYFFISAYNSNYLIYRKKYKQKQHKN